MNNQFDDRDDAWDLDTLLRPAHAFEHPSDVVNDPDLTLNEKRAILASWASDTLCEIGEIVSRCFPRSAGRGVTLSVHSGSYAIKIGLQLPTAQNSSDVANPLSRSHNQRADERNVDVLCDAALNAPAPVTRKGDAI